MPILSETDDGVWILETDEMAYVFGIGPEETLEHRYWGPPLADVDDYPGRTAPDVELDRVREEAAPWGGIRFKEPAFKVTYEDGTRVMNLEIEDAQAAETESGEELSLTLSDPDYDLRITLTYTLYEGHDLLARSATLGNDGSDPITIERAFSAQWHPPSLDAYRLSHLRGSWGRETHLARTELTRGKKVLESRRGITSHQHNPWFAVDDGSADETTGDVYFGALAYSGNWKFVFEKDSFDEVQVSGGINDFDFQWQLDPDTSFTTPTFVAGFSGDGFGGASRTLHEYQRTELLPDTAPTDVRPVLYNSWYATKFDVYESEQKELADVAADLGIELFVVDDGWFGERNDDTAGLGDWTVNEEKFPNGLDSLIEYVNDLGMGFGLWIEPEMVNPDSDLYRDHPDWVYRFPDRPQSEMRNQLMLNLARTDVREHVYEAISRLLEEYEIDFLKWDMNRNLTEPGWPEAPNEKQRELWVRHTRAVYEMIDRLLQQYPDLLIETCAGGGGRVDLGILQRTHQAWISDNVDPFDRLFIQEGYSHAYAPKTMENWVTDPWGHHDREVSLEFAFHAAMNGSLGLGADITNWSEQQLQTARELVDQYKDIRSTIQNGLQYRLSSFGEGPTSAVQYVSRDGYRSVVLVYLHSKRYGQPLPPIRFRGLVENATYRIQELDQEYTGKRLMESGLEVDLDGDFQSTLLELERVN